MKRVLSLFLSCIFVLGICFSTPVVASAAEEESTVIEGTANTITDGYYTYTILETGNECALTKYSGSDSGTVVVPKTVVPENKVEYRVTKIAATAFAGNESITSITIPETITEIEDGAFSGCIALTAFEVAEGNENYSSDSGVLFKKVTTSESAEVAFKLIAYPTGKEATEYTIPESVTEIATSAFVGSDVIIVSENTGITNPDGLIIHKPLTDEFETHNVEYTISSEDNTVTGTCSCGVVIGTYASITFDDEKTIDQTKWAESVTITPNDGYLVSSLENDGFSEEPIILDENNGYTSDGSLTFYVKENVDNAEVETIIIDLGVKLDSTAPTGTIALGETSWNKYLNNVTFDLFYKEAKTVTITSADENGSGVKSVEYYVSSEMKTKTELELLADDAWFELEFDENKECTVNLTPNSKNIVYVKITDNLDHVEYICSNGIVLYSDSTSEVTSINYTYNENSDKEISVTFNSNTVNSIECGEESLDSNAYTVDKENNKIILKADYLNKLSFGTYDIKVSFNPLDVPFIAGVGNDFPADLTFSINVTKADSIISAAPTPNADLVYNGEEQELVKPGTATGGTMQYSLDGREWNDTIPAAKDAGTYTVYYKVAENENYNEFIATTPVTVTIAPKTITATLTQNSGVYNGSAHEPVVNFNDLCENETLAITVDYTVKYESNTNVGNATVTVALMDTSTAKNYTFDDNAKTTTLNYTITKGVASIKTAPTANTLTYNGGEQALVTAGSATNGTIYYTLTPKADNDTWSTAVPKAKDAGTYKVYYKVVGNDNYDGIDYSESNSVEVTIAPKQVSSVAVSVVEGGYTYTGTAFEPAVTVKINGEDTALVNTEYEVKYTNNKNAGTATATVTLTDNYISAGAEATSVTASKNFTIAKATPIASYFIFTKPESLNYDGKPKVATIDCGADVGDVTVKYYSGETLLNNAPVEAGTYTVKIEVKESTNFNATTITDATWTFTIIACEHKWVNGVCEACKTVCEHEFGDPELTKNSTCNAPGELTWTCSVCELVKITKVNPNGDGKTHDWSGDYVVTKEATCVSEGVETKICKNGCGEETTRQIAIDTNAHVMGEWVTTEQTCVTDGKKVRSCTLGCGATEIEVIKADNESHKLPDEWTVTKEANCVEDGEKIKACLNEGCTYVAKESIPADGKSHNLGEWEVTIPAKCTVKGEVTQYCQNGDCTHKVIASLKPDGKSHDFAKDFTVIEATCITAGSKFKACENEGCKEVTELTEIAINPDAHKNVVTKDAKEPTCEEKGYTGDEYCNDCKRIVEPGIEIDAKGHTESDWIIDKEATFTEEGAKHTICTVCEKELKKEVIPKRALEIPVVKIENAGSGIKVSWTQDEDATGYTVYRSEYNPSTKKWSNWKNRGTAAATKKNWTDKTVKEGVTYRFTVRSVNGDRKSAYKATKGLIYVVAPKVTVSISSTGLLAKWNKINNATSYIVYRAELAKDGNWGKWVQLGTTKSAKNTWSDAKVKSGVTYKYTVRAVVNNVKSGYVGSSEIIYLAQPVLKISNAAAGVTGKWEQVAGATGYTIYRSEYNPSIKKWTKWLNLGTTKATAKSFTDKTAKSGYTYKYTIRAVNGKLKSTYQDSNKLVCLAQPTLTISNVANGIQGKWNQVNGATGYIIYRSELKDGKWTSWTNLGTTKATAKTFTDKTVKSGTTYRYTIRAKNGSSKSSYVASNQSVFLSVPTVKISNGITGVNVSWSKIKGAESYLVYRREFVDGKWTKWAEFKTVTETSLVDETAKSGTKYRYTVRALNGKSRSMYTSTGTLYYLATPTVTAEKVDDVIKVDWTQSSGAKGYTIYRAELGADGKWSKWVVLGTASDKHSSCKDKTVKTGVTYKYTVRAVDGKARSAYVDGAQIEK